MSHQSTQFEDFKVGDDIELAGTVKFDPPDVDWVTNQPTGWLVDGTGAKRAELVVQLAALEPPTADATHTISVALAASVSATLAAGVYRTDIRFRDVDGKVMHSPTYSIDLKAAQTGVPA